MVNHQQQQPQSVAKHQQQSRPGQERREQERERLSVAYGCLALAEALARSQPIQPGDRWSLAAAALSDARALLGSGGWPPQLLSAHTATGPGAAAGGGSCAELTRAALTALRTLDSDSRQPPPPPHARDAFRAVLVALEWLE